MQRHGWTENNPGKGRSPTLSFSLLKIWRHFSFCDEGFGWTKTRCNTGTFCWIALGLEKVTRWKLFYLSIQVIPSNLNGIVALCLAISDFHNDMHARIPHSIMQKQNLVINVRSCIVAGIPAGPGQKPVKGVPGIPGDPGHLVVRFYNLRRNCWSYIQVMVRAENGSFEVFRAWNGG